MSDIKISLDSSGPRNEISVVRVDGVIDTITATDLERVMNSLLERKRYSIIVDLGGVDYISSAGWGIFISNIKEIRQHSGDIKLARMIPNVYEIFELLEFDSILKAFDSLEKAKSDFYNDSQNVGQESGLEQIKMPSGPVSQDQGSSLQVSPELREGGKPDATAEVHKVAPGSPATRKPSCLREAVMEMILKDPFLSISEMKREIGRRFPWLKASWWKVWNVLRGARLLSKKSRFRMARIKSGKSQ